jgi:hypothetical protein
MGRQVRWKDARVATHPTPGNAGADRVRRDRLRGALTARLYHFGRRAAANIGLTILARGEFSLILAALALEAGLDPRIGPFVAGYVVVLALGAPILASQSKISRSGSSLRSHRVDGETPPRRVNHGSRPQVEGV